MRAAQTASRTDSASFRWTVLSRDDDCSEFLAGAVHLVLQHFGEDRRRLEEEELHVHEACVLILTKK